MINKIIDKYTDTLIEGPDEGIDNFYDRKYQITNEIKAFKKDLIDFIVFYCDPEENSYSNQFKPTGRKKYVKKSQHEKDDYLLNLIDELSQELLNRGLIKQSHVVQNLISQFEDIGDGDYFGIEVENSTIPLDINDLSKDFTVTNFKAIKLNTIQKALEKHFHYLTKTQITLILQVIKVNIN